MCGAIDFTYLREDTFSKAENAWLQKHGGSLRHYLQYYCWKEKQCFLAIVCNVNFYLLACLVIKTYILVYIPCR